MGSESGFSTGGSDHNDSDTIVISSKSRILISPRKKGSKAVSRLLGGSAADDVVEQILRGSEGRRAEVVSKAKHSTVRVGSTEYVVHDDGNDDGRQATTRKRVTATKSADGVARREVAQQNAVRMAVERRGVADATGDPRTTHDRMRQAEENELADADDRSDYSDVSSGELSAPSSDLEDDEEERVRHRAPRAQQEEHQQRSHHHQQQPRRQAAHQQRQQSAQQADRTTDDHHGGNGVHRAVIEHDHDNSDSVDVAGPADDESDASSSTKGSSLSQREMRPSVQRKFDDQLQTPVQSSRQTTRAGTAKLRTDASFENRAARGAVAKTRPKQAPAPRHVEASDLDDSVILPTSATQEMEDLKQTLKNLAHQDPLMNGSSGAAHKTEFLSNPPKKSASFSGTSARGLGQMRKQEYAESLQNGCEEAAWSATTSALNRFEESTSKISKKLSAGRQATRAARRHEDSDSDSEGSEPSVARRLFSTPPQRVSAKGMSTPPPVPAPYVSKRTPSPQSALFQTPKVYSPMLDTSFTAASTSSAQGSRAVLSALKALQDKIRRLEEEREKLMQELSDVKVKARKREAEYASNEKKFTYELGQTKESARAAYDAIRSEREELTLELVKYEERRKAMEAELHHAHKLSSTFSAKADDLQAQVHSSETQRASQSAQTEAMRGAHKQEMRDMKSELVALQKDRDTAHEQIRQLQAQFERESQNHAETRERLHESEQTVAGITQLNDKLVSKVWEANEIATKATKKSKKLQQSQRVSTLSRPTAASRAASFSAANGATTPGRPAASTATKKARAGSISAKGPASVKNEKRGSSQLLASNNLELLRAANLGRDIPFVLGTSANRSHSIISNVQEAIRQCDTTYATPVTNPPPTPSFLKTRKSSTKVRKASTSASEQLDAMSRAGTSASILGIDGSEPSATLVGLRTRARASNGNASEAVYSATSRRPSSIRVPTPSTSYSNPMKSQIMEDLQAAVEIAEVEFAALSRKYKDAVSKVESGRDGAAQLSKGLGAMLDELEAKGKQLNLLKQVYEQASHSTINPVRHIVHSPEAVQRKTASLRILNDYRLMERDSKSPRNGAATMPGSPTNTNATSRRASFFSDDG